VADSCDCGNEVLVSIKCGELFWLALGVFASEEGLCSVELVS
jgi:hypothetical protein